MSERIYLPATLALLGEWHAAGVVPDSAEAVVAADDGEDAEYAALMTAADASRQLLGGPGRRVVVVAEVPSEVTTAGGAVRLADVVAVHVDTSDDADDEDDLAWFATQEIEQLVE